MRISIARFSVRSRDSLLNLNFNIFIVVVETTLPSSLLMLFLLTVAIAAHKNGSKAHQSMQHISNAAFYGLLSARSTATFHLLNKKSILN